MEVDDQAFAIENADLPTAQGTRLAEDTLSDGVLYVEGPYMTRTRRRPLLQRTPPTAFIVS
jgi:hypothetical protein